MFWKKLRQRLNSDLAITLESDRIWIARPDDKIPRESPTWIALDRDKRKAVAIGAEALAMRSVAKPGVEVLRYFRNGTIEDFDLAEAALRHELRRSRHGLLAPRLVVATPASETQKRALKDVLTQAGAREIVTLPIPMAAAIGAGADLHRERPLIVMVLDRDWISVGVIQKARMKLFLHTAGGLAGMALDLAAGKREQGAPITLEAVQNRIANGLGEAEVDFKECLRYLRRVREEFAQGLEPGLTLADLRQDPLLLTGPYAKRPTIRRLIEIAWDQEVIIPPQAETAVILGCQSILHELDAVILSIYNAPTPTPGWSG